ncbi:MAG: YbhB/YbcL family Raf kinase inhibitor-like protein [Thermodesulfobacteriota bacterium]
MAMQVSSRAFSDQDPIPVKYAMPGAGGENISIPLSWSNAPEGTKSFAISIIDPHPVANNWVHWIVVNIPPDATELEEGASGRKMPQGAMELQNSFGNTGYGGPQPPKGSGEHPYVVTVYSLSSEKLDLDPQADLPDFEEAIKGKVLDKAEITGTFEQ